MFFFNTVPYILEIASITVCLLNVFSTFTVLVKKREFKTFVLR